MKLLPLLVCLFFFSCARGPIKDPSHSMRLSRSRKILSGVQVGQIEAALPQHIERLSAYNSEHINFGPLKVLRSDYIQALKDLSIYMSLNKNEVHTYLEQNFDIYEVYGDRAWSQVMVTSYFAPMIPGSLKKTQEFTKPLYALPKDLHILNLNSLIAANPRLIKDKKHEAYLIKKDLKLKVSVSPHSKYASEVKAYKSRSDIYKSGVDAKVLAWVKPIDGFFMEIQGSGIIELPNKKQLRLGYAEQNGHKYEAIGKFLFDHIPKKEMSLQRIESYLSSLPADEAQEVLNKNPSYIFFRVLEGRPETAFGTEAVAGHTIATDRKYFPKGGLGVLEFPEPQFDESGVLMPDESWPMVSRFVLDQDTGGAIKGPHRVDLYSGQGEKAKRFSGPMKHRGKLYYLVPKAQR